MLIGEWDRVTGENKKPLGEIIELLSERYMGVRT